MSRAATGGLYRRRAVKPKIQIVHTVDEERTVRGTALRVIRDATIVEAPAQPDLPAMRFPHVTLPSSIVRELGPCMLQRDDLRFLREVVLPKLRRGSIVLPAQPRYRLGGSMAATGGWMFVVRARHRIGAVVARIGIGWRDHGASLVWRECVGDPNEEPSRPWVVDILDPTEFFSLNHHEVSRLARWVPVLARDLAWAVVPPGTAGDSIAPPTRRYRAVEPRWATRG